MEKYKVLSGITLSIRQMFRNLNPKYLMRFFIVLYIVYFELAVVCVIQYYHGFVNPRIKNTIQGLNSTLTIYDGNSPIIVPANNAPDNCHVNLNLNHYKVVKFRNVGEEVKLGCIFRSQETVVMWIKDGQRVEDNSVRHITADDRGTSTLHIYFIREEDFGEYQCLTYRDIPNAIHKREVTRGTLQIAFHLKLRPKETKVLFVPWGNLMILTWPFLRIHENYKVHFTFYINNKLFSVSQDTAIHHECEYTSNTRLYLSYFQDTDPRLASSRYRYRNEFMFVSHGIQQESYGVYSLEYSIKLFNETTNKTSVQIMEHWMRYVVVPPGYQHVRQEDLADTNFMAKHFHVLENLAISDWYIYNRLMTQYEYISVWSWICVFYVGYYCIICQVLYPLLMVVCNHYFHKCIQKHKCFVFCSDEDRNFVQRNTINDLKCNGVNVGFNHEVDDFNQIGRTSFENISDILNNYEHIMIYLSNNYASDVDELQVLYFIMSSNPSRNKLTLIIDSYPSAELRDIVHKLFRICRWTSRSKDILLLLWKIHSYMSEEKDLNNIDLH